jgi:para-aminobenzoate synthetase/4-amino-4-deoxychorismate lyase
LGNTERHSVFRLRLQLNPAQPRDASGALDALTDLTDPNDPNGSRAPNALDITLTPLAPLHGAQKIFWAHDLLGESAARIDSTAPLFRHKTTSRELYDRAWRAAEQHGGFDALFVNERGEVTEGGRSTLFIRRAGEWLTPALTCGLLSGVMRAEILADPAWQAREAVISLADVMDAEALIVVNALRGVIAIDRAKSLEVPLTQI